MFFGGVLKTSDIGASRECDPAKIEKMRADVEARAEEERRKHTSKKEDVHAIDLGELEAAVEANETGDAHVYRRLNEGQFIYVANEKQWLCWRGNHWAIDHTGRALAGVNRIIVEYNRLLAHLYQEKRGAADDEAAAQIANRIKIVKRRVFDLHSIRRRERVLQMAATAAVPMSIIGDEIDQQPNLFPVANGVLNLETGELEAGRPSDYMVRASTVEWRGPHEPCPVFEALLQTSLEAKEELIAYLQRSLGYALWGEVPEHKFLIWIGQGRNGKGVVANSIMDVFGQLAAPMRPEILLDQGRTGNSAAPTSDIMALRGLRAAFASETDKFARFSPARVKWLCGADRLTGRNPHDKHETQFKPTHTLFLLTNTEPAADPDDFAFWERCVLIPWRLSFVDREPEAENERQADPELPVKLREEYPGILAWLWRGFNDYRRQGLNPPEEVTRATSEYREGEDVFSEFVAECLADTESADETVESMVLYQLFKDWWSKSMTKTPPSHHFFGRAMKRRYQRGKDPQTRRTVYQGLSIKSWPGES